MSGEPRGPVFMDSDVYKWLEAAAWEYARRAVRGAAGGAAGDHRDRRRGAAAGRLPRLDRAAPAGGERYRELVWSHEHYCAGHLFQAAVAQVRCTGERGLLDVAVRLADHLVADLRRGRPARPGRPPRGRDGAGGAVPGDRDPRLPGPGPVLRRGPRPGPDRQGYGREPAYFSDRVPVREQTTVEGHAVRAVYLGAGAADVAVELGDAELLAALERQFAAMEATKTYLTGGLGSRWDGEAFGDPYELPAGPGLRGELRGHRGRLVGLADAARHRGPALRRRRRTQAVQRLPRRGVPERGRVLLRQPAAHPAGRARRREPEPRARPASLVRRRLLPAQHHADAREPARLPRHHGRRRRAAAPVRAEQHDGDAARGRGPHHRGDRVPVGRPGPCPDRGGAGGGVDLLAARPRLGRGRDPAGRRRGAAGCARHLRARTRSWRPGDTVELSLPMAVRFVEADERIDAVRGCVAIERGPLVYAVEQVDQADGVVVDDLRLDPAGPASRRAPRRPAVRRHRGHGRRPRA